MGEPEPGATRSLIERSELVDWCLVVCRVRFCVRNGQLVSREHIARNKPVPRACAILPHQFWGLARAVGAFLKTGPPCRVCPCSIFLLHLPFEVSGNKESLCLSHSAPPSGQFNPFAEQADKGFATSGLCSDEDGISTNRII